jgi:hypothetical protein
VFDVYCQRCAGRRLIFAGQVRGLVNDDEGIAVAYECWCGDVGVWRTGKARAAARDVRVPSQPVGDRARERSAA